MAADDGIGLREVKPQVDDYNSDFLLRVFSVLSRDSWLTSAFTQRDREFVWDIFKIWEHLHPHSPRIRPGADEIHHIVPQEPEKLYYDPADAGNIHAQYLNLVVRRTTNSDLRGYIETFIEQQNTLHRTEPGSELGVEIAVPAGQIINALFAEYMPNLPEDLRPGIDHIANLFPATRSQNSAESNGIRTPPNDLFQQLVMNAIAAFHARKIVPKLACKFGFMRERLGLEIPLVLDPSYEIEKDHTHTYALVPAGEYNRWVHSIKAAQTDDDFEDHILTHIDGTKMQEVHGTDFVKVPIDPTIADTVIIRAHHPVELFLGRLEDVLDRLKSFVNPKTDPKGPGVRIITNPNDPNDQLILLEDGGELQKEYRAAMDEAVKHIPEFEFPKPLTDIFTMGARGRNASEIGAYFNGLYERFPDLQEILSATDSKVCGIIERNPDGVLSNHITRRLEPYMEGCIQTFKGQIAYLCNPETLREFMEAIDRELSNVGGQASALRTKPPGHLRAAVA